jgi:hypothetical protein
MELTMVDEGRKGEMGERNKYKRSRHKQTNDEKKWIADSSSEEGDRAHHYRTKETKGHRGGGREREGEYTTGLVHLFILFCFVFVVWLWVRGLTACWHSSLA